MSNYLMFKASGIMFACAFEDIIRIAPAVGVEYTPAPAFPEYMKGTAVIGGEVMPVIDAAARFGFEGSGDRSYSCLIISQIEKGSAAVNGEELSEKYARCAMLVDEVCGSAEVEDVFPPPAVNKDSYAKYVGSTFIYGKDTCYVIKPQLVIGE